MLIKKDGIIYANYQFVKSINNLILMYGLRVKTLSGKHLRFYVISSSTFYYVELSVIFSIQKKHPHQKSYVGTDFSC